MCGRYTIVESLNQLAERFRAALPPITFVPRYNAAPSQLLPVVIQDEAGRRIVLMRWGLIPSWAADASIGNRLINARAETVLTKPSFRGPARSRRCLIPADGFYEWLKGPEGKQPMRITPRGQRIMAFAGLWDRWTDDAGKEVQSFTIITTAANEAIRHIHDRMPLVLSPADEERWLDLKTTVADLKAILETAVSTGTTAYAVSKRVNSAKTDDSGLIEPNEDEGGLFKT